MLHFIESATLFYLLGQLIFEELLKWSLFDIAMATAAGSWSVLLPVQSSFALQKLGRTRPWAGIGIPDYQLGSSTIISCVLLNKSCGICYISTTLPCWSGVEGVQELYPASALVRSWWQRRWPNKIIFWSLSKKFKNLYHDTSDCFWQFIGQSRKLFFYLDVF